MEYYKINTSLFGLLDIPAVDGLCEDFEIILSEQEMGVTLIVFEDFLNDENIKIVSGFLENIPNMYQAGKTELLKVKESSELVKYFIEFHLDELSEDMLTVFEVDSVDEITSERFINQLKLRTVSIAPDRNNEIDCTLDFSLPEEYTDELLVVRFNTRHQIYDLSHES